MVRVWLILVFLMTLSARSGSAMTPSKWLAHVRLKAHACVAVFNDIRHHRFSSQLLNKPHFQQAFSSASNSQQIYVLNDFANHLRAEIYPQLKGTPMNLDSVLGKNRIDRTSIILKRLPPILDSLPDSPPALVSESVGRILSAVLHLAGQNTVLKEVQPEKPWRVIPEAIIALKEIVEAAEKRPSSMIANTIEEYVLYWAYSDLGNGISASRFYGDHLQIRLISLDILPTLLHSKFIPAEKKEDLKGFAEFLLEGTSRNSEEPEIIREKASQILVKIRGPKTFSVN